MKQPWLGILFGVVIFAVGIPTYLVLKSLGFAPMEIVFITLPWNMFVVATLGNRPFHKVGQPLQTVSAYAFGWLIWIVQLTVMNFLGFDYHTWTFPWVATAFIVYLVIMIHLEGKIFGDLPQPIQGIANNLSFYAIAAFFIGALYHVASWTGGAFPWTWFDYALWWVFISGGWLTSGMKSMAARAITFSTWLIFGALTGELIFRTLFDAPYGSLLQTTFYFWLIVAPLWVGVGFHNWPWSGLGKGSAAIAGGITAIILAIVMMQISLTVLPMEESLALAGAILPGIWALTLFGAFPGPEKQKPS